MEPARIGTALLAEMLMQALRSESAARVAGNDSQLAAALAHRRHLNLLLMGGLPVGDARVIDEAARAGNTSDAGANRK